MTIQGEVSAELEKVLSWDLKGLGQQRTFVTNHGEVIAELEKVLS